MKDKSRFASSVIVSLLAGFIYFLFGQDINENVQSSIKAIISSNDVGEQFITSECQPFKSISDNSFTNSKKNKSKFYIKKRNTIEFQDKDITIPGEELFSSYVSRRAKLDKPVPDKNSDFTAELDLLITKNNDSKTGKPPELSFLLREKDKKDDVVADSRSYERRSEKLSKNFEQTKSSSFVKYSKGNAEYRGSGFEYNYVTGETTYTQPGASSNETTSTAPESKCNSYKVEFKKTTKVINGEKIIIMTPKAHINKSNEDMNDEDMDSDDNNGEPQEINNDDSGNEDTM